MMKTLFILLLLPYILKAQLSTQVRLGYAAKWQRPIVSPALRYEFKGLALTGEMIVITGQQPPADFGCKISYQYKFIEAGYGRYYELYSTDTYDKFRNHWTNLFFVSAFYKNYFFEADSKQYFTLGVRYYFKE